MAAVVAAAWASVVGGVAVSLSLRGCVAVVVCLCGGVFVSLSLSLWLRGDVAVAVSLWEQLALHTPRPSRSHDAPVLNIVFLLNAVERPVADPTVSIMEAKSGNSAPR